MVAARPFQDTTTVLVTAEEAWWDLGAGDWVETFGAQPSANNPPALLDYHEEHNYPYIAFAADDGAGLFDELQRASLDVLNATNVACRGTLA